MYICAGAHTLESASDTIGLCRLTSGQHLIMSTIREFSIGTAPRALEVLCCLYCHSSYQMDHSMLWRTVVGVYWLTLCYECRASDLGSLYCSYCTPRSFFPFWGIAMPKLWWWLHFDGWAVCVNAGSTRYFGHTSEHLCGSSMQNLAVPQDFYCPVSVSLKQSCWAGGIRWCGAGEFEEYGQCLIIGLAAAACLPLTIIPFSSFILGC